MEAVASPGRGDWANRTAGRLVVVPKEEKDLWRKTGLIRKINSKTGEELGAEF